MDPLVPNHGEAGHGPEPGARHVLRGRADGQPRHRRTPCDLEDDWTVITGDGGTPRTSSTPSPSPRTARGCSPRSTASAVVRARVTAERDRHGAQSRDAGIRRRPRPGRGRAEGTLRSGPHHRRRAERAAWRPPTPRGPSATSSGSPRDLPERTCTSCRCRPRAAVDAVPAQRARRLRSTSRACGRAGRPYVDGQPHLLHDLAAHRRRRRGAWSTPGGCGWPGPWGAVMLAGRVFGPDRRPRRALPQPTPSSAVAPDRAEVRDRRAVVRRSAGRSRRRVGDGRPPAGSR